LLGNTTGERLMLGPNFPESAYEFVQPPIPALLQRYCG
jgi:hypothetical protein